MIEGPQSMIDIVSLARKHELLSLLPYALYCCCRDHTALQIRTGVQRRDRTTALLSLEDQLACLTGYQSLVRVQATTTYSWVYPNAATYQSCRTIACTPARRSILINTFTPLPPVQGLEDWNSEWEGNGMCKYCIEVAQVAHRAGRQKLWDQLPTIFNLPPWEELVKERDELYVFIPSSLCLLTTSLQLSKA